MTINSETQDQHLLIKGENEVAGTVFEFTYPRSELRPDRSGALVSEIFRRGGEVEQSKYAKLIKYLSKQRPGVKTSVSKVGWHKGSDEKWVFVLPDIIYGSTDNAYVYQPEGGNTSTGANHCRGTLGDWQEHVEKPFHDYPLANFIMGVAFAAPLMKPLGLDGGGFNICGHSSGGKTTAMQRAASVIGCGADPATLPGRSYIRRWHTTANGLEGIAMAHNDLIICMDELGTSGIKDFGATVYNLAGGMGKEAMQANREMRKARSWQTMILSTGEHSVASEIERTSGRQAKAGQMIRLMDLVTDGSVFPSGEKNISEEVRRLKDSCAQYYGVAGREFISRLVRVVNDDNALIEMRSRFDSLSSELVTAEMSNEQSRAVQRFSVVELALHLAHEWGVISLPYENIKLASRAALDIWLREFDTVSDVDRCIDGIKDHILQNLKRFPPLTAADSVEQVAIIGYQDISKKLFLFYPTELKELCGKAGYKSVLREIDRLGFLFKNDTDGRGSYRLLSKHSVGRLGQRPFYAIKMKFLDDGGPAPGAIPNSPPF